MINHEPDREHQQTEADARAKRTSLPLYLESVTGNPRVRALSRQVRVQTDRDHAPGQALRSQAEELDPAFDAALGRLWDIGTLAEGRADTELRRTYHLIVQGRAPLSEADVITLGTMPEAQLRLLLPWLAHQLSLAEATQCVARGEPAPPVVTEEQT